VTDQDGPTAQLGPVALLDRRIERIEVGVEDGGLTTHEHMFAHGCAAAPARAITFPVRTRPTRRRLTARRSTVADGDDAATTVVVVMTGDDVVVVRVDGGPPDLAVVDGLARLTLALKRGGRALRVEEPPPELTELLDLCGLSHLLAPGTSPETL
jgi:hypothetical protein